MTNESGHQLCDKTDISARANAHTGICADLAMQLGLHSACIKYSCEK